MTSCMQELARLSMRIERMLDADALLAEDAAALQKEVAQACRSLAAGDLESTRRYVLCVVSLTEALVQMDALDPGDGRALLEMTRCLLAEDAG